MRSSATSRNMSKHVEHNTTRSRNFFWEGYNEKLSRTSTKTLNKKEKYIQILLIDAVSKYVGRNTYYVEIRIRLKCVLNRNTYYCNLI